MFGSITATQGRPTGITVLGTVLVLGGVLALPGYFAVTAWTRRMSDLVALDPAQMIGGIEAWTDIQAQLLRIQVGLAAPNVVLGLGLLTLRPWARTVSVVISWLGLAAAIPTAMAIGSWARTFTEAADLDPALRNINDVASFVNATYYGTLLLGTFGLAIWYLRRPAVKEAFVTGHQNADL